MKLQLLFVLLAMVLAMVMGSPKGGLNNLRTKNDVMLKNEKAKPCHHLPGPPEPGCPPE